MPIEIFRGRTVRKDHYGTSRAGQAEKLAVGHAVDTLFIILMYSIVSMAYACPSFFVRYIAFIMLVFLNTALLIGRSWDTRYFKFYLYFNATSTCL